MVLAHALDEGAEHASRRIQVLLSTCGGSEKQDRQIPVTANCIMIAEPRMEWLVDSDCSEAPLGAHHCSGPTPMPLVQPFPCTGTSVQQEPVREIRGSDRGDSRLFETVQDRSIVLLMGAAASIRSLCCFGGKVVQVVADDQPMGQGGTRCDFVGRRPCDGLGSSPRRHPGRMEHSISNLNSRWTRTQLPSTARSRPSWDDSVRRPHAAI